MVVQNLSDYSKAVNEGLEAFVEEVATEVAEVKAAAALVYSLYDSKATTTTERNAISAPVEGREIYNLTTHAKEFWNGSVWKTILTN